MARNNPQSARSQRPADRNARAKANKPAKTKQGAGNEQSSSSLFDDNIKRDIIGVCFAVLAIALWVTVNSQSAGIVTTFMNDWLHRLFGIGCYALPFFLAAVGATFLVRFEKERVPLRTTLGLTLIFIALLGLFSLQAPGADSGKTDQIFVFANVVSEGGYIGGGLAWCGVTLFGKLVSTIVLVGVIVVGIVIIGFSINGLVDKIRAKHAEIKEKMGTAEQPELPFQPNVRRAKAQKGAAAGQDATEAMPTVRISNRADRKVRGAVPTIAPIDDGYDAEAATPTVRIQEPKTRRSNRLKSDDLADEEVQQQMTRKLGKRKRGDESDDQSDASDRSANSNGSSSDTSVEPSGSTNGFKLPDLSLLKTSKGKPKARGMSQEELSETAQDLQDALESFGVAATVVDWQVGPTVTLYKISLPSGVRVNKVTALTDDIALALASSGVRIFAPVPGTNYVGIEVPNRERQTVLLGDVIPAAMHGSMLNMCIGKDVEGNNIVADLAKMPHLLIGGTTGSGKSVTVNSMIMTILMRATPDEVRFIMIDPKRVEFSLYNGIPHLYVPVVTEPKEASSALSWGVAEMERRLKIFEKAGVRNIAQYNQKCDEGAFEDGGAKLPYIVIVIDELADLMMNVGKEVEFSISRIAQLARAAGIHLIIATQRPSANVVTGLIKANITNRIALNVASGIDSRVILDTPGAENLLSHGDLLFSKPEYPKPQRMQSCYVDETEINAVVEALKSQGSPEYHNEILKTNTITLGDSQPDGSGGSVSSDDPLIWEAADIVVSSGFGSTSNIQRRLKVGYSRAGRIMDMLEEKGIVGPPNGSKPRDVLVDTMELETLKAFEANDSALS